MSRARKPSDVTDKQRALRTDTAERLEAIVEAAERAAESVIDDAEAQAHRYLAQARAEADRLVDGRASGLAELIDTLLGQATSLRQEAERLQAALEGAKALVEAGEPAEPAGGRQEPSQEPDQPEVPRLRAVAQPDDSQPAKEERRSDAAGARLLATQLAVSGSSREEIAQRLRNGFEIEDTDAILDAILGPEER
jgi:cell division septum initiation protein DivIVA